MPSKSTKGLHRTLVLVVDGVQQAGSFAKARSFEATPDASIMKTEHLGESESEVDLMHHGWDGKFTLEEEDAAAAKVYEKYVTASADGTTMPRVSLMEIRRYVDPAILPETLLYEEMVLKLDNETASGRKEYNLASFSFSAKRRKRVGV
jgi:hypothetical protein